MIESWIHAKATNTNRGALYGVYQIVNFAASASGQLLLRGLDPFLSFRSRSAPPCLRSASSRSR